MQTSFGSMKMEACAGADSVLMKAHALIDWEGLRDRFVGLNKCDANRMGGQEVIDPLVMFKAVLLGQWHNLSDSKLEEALRVRIDFMHFCGMDFSDDAPDETTLCRFRNRLIASGRLAGLLGQPLAAASNPSAKPVWHCALRTAPGDRRLSDGEWAQVATEVVDLRPGSVVTGSIVAPSLILHDGALFSGRVEPNQVDAALSVARFQRKQRDAQAG